MTQELVEMYLMTHGEYFPADKIPFLRERLLELDEEKAKYLQCVELQKPTTNLLFSIFLGRLGVDRFIIGDVGLGVLKLLTGGCCGVMWFVDMFLITGRTKEKNFDKIWKTIA